MPLIRSAQRRMISETGQPVSDRKIRVSALIGVRNWRTDAESSAGSSVKVGRLDPFSDTSGKIEVNERKIALSACAVKKGLASALPASSYCAAIDETLSDSGLSL